MSGLSKDKHADIWLSHTDKLWRTVFSTPLIAIAIFVAWFALSSDCQFVIARFCLLLGVGSMAVMFLIISRMAQYDGTLFRDIAGDLPELSEPMFGLHGEHLAQSVPLLLIVLFMKLFTIGDFSFASAACEKAGT